jgi:hypothetical protein
MVDNYSNAYVNYPKGYLGITYSAVGVTDIMSYPSLKYKPWDPNTGTYLAETSNSVTLSEFNPARDELFSNARYYKIK